MTTRTLDSAGYGNLAAPADGGVTRQLIRARKPPHDESEAAVVGCMAGELPFVIFVKQHL